MRLYWRSVSSLEPRARVAILGIVILIVGCVAVVFVDPHNAFFYLMAAVVLILSLVMCLNMAKENLEHSVGARVQRISENLENEDVLLTLLKELCPVLILKRKWNLPEETKVFALKFQIGYMISFHFRSGKRFTANYYPGSKLVVIASSI